MFRHMFICSRYILTFSLTHYPDIRKQPILGSNCSVSHVAAFNASWHTSACQFIVGYSPTFAEHIFMQLSTYIRVHTDANMHAYIHMHIGIQAYRHRDIQGYACEADGNLARTSFEACLSKITQCEGGASVRYLRR